MYREGAEESLAEIENTWIPYTLKPYHYKLKFSCYLVEKCDNLKVKQDLDMSMKVMIGWGRQLDWQSSTEWDGWELTLREKMSVKCSKR